MPIGAAIGAGALTAGATVVAGSKNASAINKSTEAQTQANRDSLELQRNIYDENKATLSPFVATGQPATQAINALLGLPAPQQAQPQPNALAPYGAASYGVGLDGQPIYVPPVANPPYAMSAAPTTPTVTPQTAQSAFDNYRKSTGYNFRFNEGMRGLNSGYAGRGVLQSGDAIKRAIDYAQNAGSAEFGNYFDRLADQQRIGLTAASAQAGVGQSFAGNASNLNTANANALAAGAVAKANNSNAMISGIGSAAGSVLNTPGIFGQQVNALYTGPYAGIAPSAASTIRSNPGIF